MSSITCPTTSNTPPPRRPGAVAPPEEPDFVVMGGWRPKALYTFDRDNTARAVSPSGRADAAPMNVRVIHPGPGSARGPPRLGTRGQTPPRVSPRGYSSPRGAEVTSRDDYMRQREQAWSTSHQRGADAQGQGQGRRPKHGPRNRQQRNERDWVLTPCSPCALPPRLPGQILCDTACPRTETDGQGDYHYHQDANQGNLSGPYEINDEPPMVHGRAGDFDSPYYSGLASANPVPVPKEIIDQYPNSGAGGAINASTATSYPIPALQGAGPAGPSTPAVFRSEAAPASALLEELGLATSPPNSAHGRGRRSHSIGSMGSAPLLSRDRVKSLARSSYRNTGSGPKSGRSRRHRSTSPRNRRDEFPQHSPLDHTIGQNEPMQQALLDELDNLKSTIAHQPLATVQRRLADLQYNLDAFAHHQPTSQPAPSLKYGVSVTPYTPSTPAMRGRSRSPEVGPRRGTSPSRRSPPRTNSPARWTAMSPDWPYENTPRRRGPSRGTGESSRADPDRSDPVHWSAWRPPGVAIQRQPSPSRLNRTGSPYRNRTASPYRSRKLYLRRQPGITGDRPSDLTPHTPRYAESPAAKRAQRPAYNGLVGQLRDMEEDILKMQAERGA
eukprot:gene3200-615_t